MLVSIIKNSLFIFSMNQVHDFISQCFLHTLYISMPQDVGTVIPIKK